LKFLSYCPGLGAYGPGEYPPFVRSITPDDVRGVLRDYASEHGGRAPAALIIAIHLLDPSRAPRGYESRYGQTSRDFENLAGELRAAGIELRGESGVLASEVLVAEAYYNAPPPAAAKEPDPVVIGETRVLHPPHRPRVYGEMVAGKIRALAAGGLGARAIHRLLKGQGIGISLSSVSKRLQRYRLTGKA